MNVVRKIIIALVGLSLALLLTVLLLNPESIRQLALSLGDTSALIRLPVAVLIDALILVIVMILVRADRSAHPASGLIVKAQGAIADVSVESARDRILRAVRTVPDVLSAEAEIKAVRGKADVDLEVVVARESSSLPEKQKEIDRALRQVVNKQLGLQLAGKPRVHLRMSDELPEPEPPALPTALPTTLAATPTPAPTATTELPAEPTPAEAPPPESVDTMSLRQNDPSASEPSTPA